MWDVWHLIRDLDAGAIGSYFDVGHATVEGGYGGWRIGLNLLMPRIIMVAVKDMAYRKHPERGWRPHWGPLGQGMVRFTETFKRLKEQGFAGPVALHKEYGNYAAPIGSKQDQENLAEVRQDIVFMVNVLKKAGLT
jgi:sugar phosphate isomerase/epimerase